MRYWVCVLAGLILFAGCIYAFSHALTELLDTGTCASGNTPYVIAKECPDGTGANIFLLVGSSFGLFASVLLFAFRGDPPGGGGGRGRGVSPFLAGWAIFFTVTGLVSMLHALSSDTIPDDGKAGGIIVGGTFLLLGLPVLVYLIWVLLSGGRDDRPAGLAGAMGFSAPPPVDHTSTQQAGFGSTAGFTAGPTATGGDRIAELERLDRLRRSGALTEAEFEREKARLLGG